MKRTALFVAASCVWMFSAELPSSASPAAIHGCVNKSNGSLRIVSAPIRCGGNETRISWNNIQGMNAVVYGMVNLIAGGGQIMPSPATFTVTHTSGTGEYKIAFTPSPFIPSVPGPHGFDNAPTCLATSRKNPNGTSCTANVGYDTSTGAWNATINCTRQSGAAADADFAFACFQ
jgi:hypothetical protein